MLVELRKSATEGKLTIRRSIKKRSGNKGTQPGSDTADFVLTRISTLDIGELNDVPQARTSEVQSRVVIYWLMIGVLIFSIQEPHAWYLKRLAPTRVVLPTDHW